jgi:hypothetical protein
MKIQDISNTAEFLATLDRDQLKEYAQNNAGNPYLVSLALFVSDQQKAVDRNKQAKVQPQGSVVDSAIENIAPMARATMPAEDVKFDQEMPEDSGIGQIPVEDTYFGANGGISAFADGDLVVDYGAQLDAAKAKEKAVRQGLQGLGLKFRQQQPEAYAGTLAAMEQATQERNLAEDEYSKYLSTQPESKAFFTGGPQQVAARQPANTTGTASVAPAAYPDESQRGPMTGTTPSATSVDGAARMSPAAPRGAALPSSKPLDIEAMFEAEKKKRVVTDSPYKSQLEAIAKSEQEFAKAETAGLEAIQAKYADITKGQRDRQDAKEKAIEAMDNQGLGIGLLLFGAELMSKRRPDAGVAAKGYLANREKVAEARDKLSESRDRLEAAEAQRGELNATQLNKLRMNERRVGISAQKEMLKAIQDEYQVGKEEGLKILDLRIREALDNRKDDRADRRAMMQINARDKTPAQQIFDRLLAQKGGDPVAAQQEYNRMFADKPEVEYRKALLQKKADVISGPLGSNEMGRAQIAAIDAEIAKMGGRQPSATPSAAAIAALKANPNLAAEFDKKFNGTSAQYLR